MPSTKLPTIPQMVTRSNAAHREALVSYTAGRYPLDDLAARGLLHEARGMRTAVKTLLRWQCFEVVDCCLRPSARGALLLKLLLEREEASRATMERACAPLAQAAR